MRFCCHPASLHRWDVGKAGGDDRGDRLDGHFDGRKCMRVGGRWFNLCYLHVGEGAGKGAGTRPPLLLQSSAQHLKLPLLLPHRGQQGGRTRTLLHSHAESRGQDRTGQDRVNTRDLTNTGTSSKNRQNSPVEHTVKEEPWHSDTWNTHTAAKC